MAKKSFVKGMLILMAAGLVVRLFGFYYRIYLSNLIGAEGMGLFQLISPLYSLIILTLTSGVSIAVSKLVAQEYARRHFVNLSRITWCALVLVVIAGIIISVVMYFNLGFITRVLLKDNRTYFAMIFILPCIPVIAAASAVKGYFYGIQNMVPTAVSQVVEQVVRIGIVVASAGYFMKMGLEYACAMAMAAMAIGEISNLAVLIIAYRINKNKADKVTSEKGFMRKRTILKSIFKIALPISSNRFLTSLMSAIEYILIPRMLLAGGFDYSQSISMYGRLTGMAMPIIYFPSIVTSSMATTLVPALAEAVSLRNFRAVNHRISRAFQITFMLGFIFTAIFIVFSGQISDVIYRNEDVGRLLYLMAFSCILIYLHQTLAGILNGLGKEKVLLRNSLTGYLMRIAFVITLIPKFGIESYIFSLIASLAVVSVLDLVTIVKTTGLALEIGRWFIRPGIVCLILVLTGKYIYWFFNIFTSKYKLLVAASVAGCFAGGLCLMFVAGVLDKKEILKQFNLSKKS